MRVESEPAYRLAYLRHTATALISQGKDVALAPAILSPGEISLSRERQMVLPRPLLPSDRQRKWVDPTLWDMVVEQLVKDGQVVYVLTGVFDVFTGGHWLLVDSVRKLIQSMGDSGREGKAVVRLESDMYAQQWKANRIIFPRYIRAGWFEPLPVYRVTIFPTDVGGSLSWDFGNQLLAGDWPDNIDLQTAIVFVLPGEMGWMSKREREALATRESQVRRWGFGVVRVPSQLRDVSSSLLRKRFSLPPIREDG